MAIYVTGDTHGAGRLGPDSVDGFMRRLNRDSFPEQKELTKEDFVVILGDFGGVWAVSRTRVQESPPERDALDWLEKRPFTTLFVPGNHENYDRLTGCTDERLLGSWLFAKMPEAEKEKLRQGLPRRPWHGGFVRQVRPSVLMLERGCVFDLGGASCFAFGGARSHDIQDGVLCPEDCPDEAAFQKRYRALSGGRIRVKGVSWWAQEMPSPEEMEAGRRAVRAHMAAHGPLDFVFTHDAPSTDRRALGFEETDDLSDYLDSLRSEMQYGAWFYGHLHDNRRMGENRYLLYEQIVRIR